MVYINNRVLLPRIEYRAQHLFLAKSVCDRLQSPMMQIIKNKASMPITIANQVLAHKHIAGVRTIWQNQLAHHITELNARMNSNDDVGEITWLRLCQAQLDCKSIFCITQKDTSRPEKTK